MARQGTRACGKEACGKEACGREDCGKEDCGKELAPPRVPRRAVRREESFSADALPRSCCAAACEDRAEKDGVGVSEKRSQSCGKEELWKGAAEEPE